MMPSIADVMLLRAFRAVHGDALVVTENVSAVQSWVRRRWFALQLRAAATRWERL